MSSSSSAEAVLGGSGWPAERTSASIIGRVHRNVAPWPAFERSEPHAGVAAALPLTDRALEEPSLRFQALSPGQCRTFLRLSRYDAYRERGCVIEEQRIGGRPVAAGWHRFSSGA